MSIPTILFFARSYQASYFPELRSDRYRQVFATLTRNEKRAVEAKGGEVVGCFEEDFDRLVPAEIPADYLLTSYMSDRFLGRFGHEKRREILGKEIAFWRGIMEKHKPVAVLNELVAIEISEVLLVEAWRCGAKYLAGMNAPVDDFFYWLGNPMTLSAQYLEQRAPSEQSRKLAAEYVEQLVARDYKPFYVRNLRGRLNPFAFMVAVAKLAYWKWVRAWCRITGKFVYEVYDDEYGKKVSVTLKSLVLRYDSLASLPKGAEVVFYPLHQEPEATLNYMSEFNANQVATIENILKCLGPHQVLVVKEHPVDKGALLRGKFRELKSRCSSLFYLPAEISGREVLAVAPRVVTLTSTVGWEAAATGKEVFVLGQIFFDRFSGARAITDFDSLRAALKQPPRLTEPRRQEVQEFVAMIMEQSQPGNPFPHERLYDPANTRVVLDALLRGASL